MCEVAIALHKGERRGAYRILVKKKAIKSMLTAKVRIYKGEAFKLPLVHGLE